MFNPLFIFLPGIIILGLITSYTDIKISKIRNKHILFSLIYSLLGFVVLATIFNAIYTKFFLMQTILNFLFAAFIGYIFWDVGIWTAGDGKLFTAYSALIPLFIYNDLSFVPYFSSFNILINTFVPLFLFFFIHLMFTTSFEDKKNSFQKILDLKKVLGLIVTLFGMEWFSRFLFSFFDIEFNIFMVIFVLFIFVTIIEKFMSLNFMVLLSILAVLRIIFDPLIYDLAYLRYISFIIALFLITRYFLLDLGFASYTKKIPINKLKVGMLPAEAFYEKQGRIVKKKFLFFSFSAYFKEKYNREHLDKNTEGLVKEDIDKLKDMQKKHPDLKDFLVQETLPFAPFMFLGVLITIIFSGNVFYYVSAYLPIFLERFLMIIKSLKL